MSAKLMSLKQAVVTNRLEEVRALVHPKNVNFTDVSEGLSLLSLAVSLGYVDMAELLLQRGASVSQCDRNGFQPIHRAVWSKNVAMVKLLLVHNADPLAENRKNHRTTLSLAAMCGSVEIAQVLVSHKRSEESVNIVDSRDIEGRSALDIAAASGNHEMVAYLLSSGADAYYSRVCAEEGAENARTWAERRSFDEINRLLCQSWTRQSVVTL